MRRSASLDARCHRCQDILLSLAQRWHRVAGHIDAERQTLAEAVLPRKRVRIGICGAHDTPSAGGTRRSSIRRIAPGGPSDPAQGSNGRSRRLRKSA
jgi:hypothetical protein